MIKKAKASKDNIVKFPSKLSDLDKEIEAVSYTHLMLPTNREV